MNKFKGVERVIKNASSPGTIANTEHHDKSGSQKNLNGTPGTVKEIIADSTAITPVDPGCVVRVTNTTGSTQFLFVGLNSEAPAGVPTIADSLALPPNHTEHLYIGLTVAPNEGTVLKSSSSSVQLIVME